MSEFYAERGQLVICEGEDGKSSPVTLPINGLYPKIWCICDCSKDEGCAYIPYRVYPNDEVVVKPILEGDALIPADMAGVALYGGTISDTGILSVSATIVQIGGYCINKQTDGYWSGGKWYPATNSCPGYGSRTYCKKTPGTYMIGGAVNGTSACDYGSWYGWYVYGTCNDLHVGDKSVEVFARNAYEYIEIEVSPNFGEESGDTIRFYGTSVSGVNPSWATTWPIHWYRVGNIIYVDCYPYIEGGGLMGKSKVDNGYANISARICVAGGTGAMQIDLTRDMSILDMYIRTVTLKGKTTGRYGNYQ